jgi:hypothetical protein
MPGVIPVPKPSKGCLARPYGLPNGGWDKAMVDRYSETPVATSRKADCCKACGRSPGEIPDKIIAEMP